MVSFLIMISLPMILSFSGICNASVILQEYFLLPNGTVQYPWFAMVKFECIVLSNMLSY